MEPSKQRIKIAEACGWRKCDPEKVGSHELYHLKGSGFSLLKDLPDYPNDLNAMHEVERTLSEEQYFQYIMVLDCFSFCEKQRVQWAVSSTATQRAEAFLRTKGLWEEKENVPQSSAQHTHEA